MHCAVAGQDYPTLGRILSTLPRLPKAGEVTTEEELILAEQRADIMSGCIDRRDVPGRETTIHVVVRLGDCTVVEMLMAAGANWSLQNEQGWNALPEAVSAREDVIAMTITRYYAVELVSNRSIIFMDEPTSGLDARAAATVMRMVRNTVDTGRTVVCTIHQPIIDIFDAFDELVLMKRGGQMIYVGPPGRHSQMLIDYLEAIDDVPKIKPGINPATWMLEVISLSSETLLRVDFSEIYRNSSLYQHNKILIQELSQPAPGSKDLCFERQFRQSFAVQTMACLWKQHCSYWRNPQYNTVRLIFTFCCALIFGSIFWRIDRNMQKKQDILNALGSMFAAIIFLGFSNAVAVQPVVDVERTVFYREKAAGMYSALPYATAQVLIEAPYVYVQTLVYGVVVYACTGLTWTTTKFFWYLFFMLFTFLYTTYYGMMMAQTNLYRPGIDITQAELVPHLNWRRQEMTEMVGPWKAKIYDMLHVMLSVKSQRVPGAMTDEELFTTENDKFADEPVVYDEML